MSVSVEHCQNGDVAARVHLHCYMSGGRHKLSNATFELLEFQNVRVGHVAFTGYGTKGDNAVIENQASTKKVKFITGRANEAHYYLQFLRRLVHYFSRRTSTSLQILLFLADGS